MPAIVAPALDGYYCFPLAVHAHPSAQDLVSMFFATCSFGSFRCFTFPDPLPATHIFSPSSGDEAAEIRSWEVDLQCPAPSGRRDDWKHPFC